MSYRINQKNARKVLDSFLPCGNMGDNGGYDMPEYRSNTESRLSADLAMVSSMGQVYERPDVEWAGERLETIPENGLFVVGGGLSGVFDVLPSNSEITPRIMARVNGMLAIRRTGRWFLANPPLGQIWTYTGPMELPNLHRCHNCNELTTNAPVSIEGQERYLCSNHVDSVVNCDCGHNSLRGRVRSVLRATGQQQSVCPSCYNRMEIINCQYCGTQTEITDENRNNFGYVNEQPVTCPTCAVAHTARECPNCGYIHYGPDDICESCDEESISSTLEEYSFDPDFVFHGEGRSSCFIGLELEYEETDRVQDKARLPGPVYIKSLDPDYQHFYQKHDGSIGSYGAELVTQPHTYTEMMHLDWTGMLQKLQSLGYQSHDGGSCGLHFHLDREYIGDSGGRKLVYLVDKYQKDFIRFSRRKKAQIDRWAGRFFSESWLADSIAWPATDIYQSDRVIECYKTISGRGDGDRYHAVNLKNSATVELRFIRGTLKYETFVASLQLADTLADVALKPWDEIVAMSFDNIISYKNYPELLAYWTAVSVSSQESVLVGA